ncbi:hypothetical protein MTZ49_04725 [Entomomonas sp. E2T0]|uniref:hypothetical protein n=1 Tax=Entomomonas sp. E2T0 TaxID=2930213 RepID=UPI0022284779|nr:hypothetical protein [Entomomonas sp. E2T0]UYZ84875.1 hypothetical protein MTZ49_04725 [Entomomonas sp. E2T0]
MNKLMKLFSLLVVFCTYSTWIFAEEIPIGKLLGMSLPAVEKIYGKGDMAENYSKYFVINKCDVLVSYEGRKRTINFINVVLNEGCQFNLGDISDYWQDFIISNKTTQGELYNYFGDEEFYLLADCIGDCGLVNPEPELYGYHRESGMIDYLELYATSSASSTGSFARSRDLTEKYGFDYMVDEKFNCQPIEESIKYVKDDTIFEVNFGYGPQLDMTYIFSRCSQ